MLQPKRTKFRREQKNRMKGNAQRGNQLPSKPITKKPLDTRMGKGKGDPYAFVAPVTPGRIIFEAEGVSLAVAKEAMRLGANKLPIATKFVVRRDYVE